MSAMTSTRSGCQSSERSSEVQKEPSIAPVLTLPP
jgi:hypothetical protein